MRVVEEMGMIQERRNYQPLVTRPEQRASISLCDSCLVAVVKFPGALCCRCQRKRDAFLRWAGWACWCAMGVLVPVLVWNLVRK